MIVKEVANLFLKGVRMEKKISPLQTKTLLAVLFFVLCCSTAVLSQEMLVNGGFADTTGWTVYNLDSAEPSEAFFGVDDDEKPAFGDGPYLYLTGYSTYTNILIWQKLILTAGTTYEFTGAFKDLTMGEMINYWCEIYLSPEAPVDGVDWIPPGGTSTDLLTGVKWQGWVSGCGTAIDGTFQDDGCIGSGSNLYTPDGEAGEQIEIYFGVKTGVWTDQEALLFDVAIDEFSLVPEGWTGINGNSSARADKFVLQQNYPNPFNPTTYIRFSIPVKETVNLSIFDITGRLVKTLINKNLATGEYGFQWDGRDVAGAIVPSGVYFYKLQAGSFSEIKKMTFLQ